MRVIARAMVFTTLVLLFAAMLAANSVLSRGSGTYFATFMFVPFALAPAIPVWFRPNTQSFTIWAGCSAVASIIYLVGGSPYEYERALASWRYIALPMYAAIFVAVIGGTTMAWVCAARDRELLPDSARARRIRSIAKLAPLFAVTTLVLEMLVVEYHFDSVTFMTAAILALTVSPAAFVYRRPTRGVAFMWAIWSLPYAVLALLVAFADEPGMPLLARMLIMSAGTLGALLVVVLPVTALRPSEPDGALLAPAVTRR